jgi:hypothetical protein
MSGLSCLVFTRLIPCLDRLLLIKFIQTSSRNILIIIQKAPLIDKIINGNLNLKEY